MYGADLNLMAEFLVTAIAIELTPGPNMVWLALLSVSRGRKVALTAVLGIALGLTVAAVASAFGVSVLIANTSWLFHTLRVVGTIYLLYLAWDAYRATNQPNGWDFNKPLTRYALQGFVSNALNPKAYLFYAAILPQFIVISKPVLPQLTTLSVIYVAIATIIHIIIAALSGIFNKFFSDPKRMIILGRFFSALLVMVAVWFCYATKLK